jgi:hypothetical protein
MATVPSARAFAWLASGWSDLGQMPSWSTLDEVVRKRR